MVNGEVKLIGKAMGSKRANNLLNSLVMEKGGINFDMPFAVIWSGNNRDLLDKYVKDSQKLWKDYVCGIPSYMTGCTIGTHVGPGAIGFAFFEK